MKQIHPFVSFVIPAFNESANLQWHYRVITDFMATQPNKYEIIYVDDGSVDDTLAIIKKIADDNPHIAKFISFSRNFGKEAALSAGLHKTKGDVVLAIDADGQHPVDMLPAFIKKWREGNDLVIGVRGDNPSEGLAQKIGSRAFYRLLRLLDPNQEVTSRATDFRLLDRRVVDEFNKLTERNRVTRNLIDWLGFKRAYVSFNAEERHAGAVAYSMQKRIKLALDGLIKHSTKPLKFIGAIGVIISLLSVLAAFFLVVETYVFGDPLNLSVTGTAILALLLSFLIGVVLVCQGLLALYLENVYHETQNRPLYIVREEG